MMTVITMERIINVSGGKGGYSFLLIGDGKTALLDCGMAYSAQNLIKNIKHTLKNKELDYLFISHSHYDHIGAIPDLRKEWPALQIFGAEHAALILNREHALKQIRSLSQMAAGFYHADELEDYDDQLMRVDHIVFDGDSYDLGGVTVQVIETPGHTQCSLSFLINQQTLFASESTGYMSNSGQLFPCFLNSYSQAIDSIHKCAELNPTSIIVPHYGFLEKSKTAAYWHNCLKAAEKSRDFILHLLKQGYNKEQILAAYEIEFQDKESKEEQPLKAFRINAQNLIKAVLKDKQ